MIQPKVKERTPFELARFLSVPAVVGVAVVLPFIGLEWVNGGFRRGVPVPLFALMWLLVFLFTTVAMPVARRLSSGHGSLVLDVGVASRVVFLLSLAWVWVALVSDQMPCFLGVPNCD